MLKDIAIKNPTRFSTEYRFCFSIDYTLRQMLRCYHLERNSLFIWRQQNTLYEIDILVSTTMDWHFHLVNYWKW